MTGRAYLDDFGIVQGPIGLTDTNADRPGLCRHPAMDLEAVRKRRPGRSSPKPGAAISTTSRASTSPPKRRSPRSTRRRPAPVEEGNVGGGTGMVCFGFKGGIGTASRVVTVDGKSYTVGVLAQCNTGDRKVLRIAGAPVGAALREALAAAASIRSVATSAGPADAVHRRRLGGTRAARPGIDHHRRRNRRAADAEAARPRRAPRGAGAGPARLLRRQCVGRFDRQLLDRSRRGEPRRAAQAERDLAARQRRRSTRCSKRRRRRPRKRSSTRWSRRGR